MSHRRTKRAYPTLQAWMDATNTSQPELAKVLGISQSHLCNVLRGNRRASLNLTLKLAHLTNVPIESINQTSKVA
jgi:transcriptional regulator with XRE-family HTH domain